MPSTLALPVNSHTQCIHAAIPPCKNANAQRREYLSKNICRSWYNALLLWFRSLQNVRGALQNLKVLLARCAGCTLATTTAANTDDAFVQSWHDNHTDQDPFPYLARRFGWCSSSDSPKQLTVTERSPKPYFSTYLADRFIGNEGEKSTFGIRGFHIMQVSVVSSLRHSIC